MVRLFALFISITLFSIYSTSSQTYSKEWGVMADSDLELQKYAKDPTAVAVILYDIGESYFNDTDDGYNIRFTRTKRIKILNNAGIKFAEISIPYYVDGFGRTENIVSIEAVAYNNEEGGLSESSLKKNTIYEERISENWFVKKFAVPNVKEKKEPSSNTDTFWKHLLCSNCLSGNFRT